MSKVDWSLAPKWAEYVVVGPLSGFNYWANDNRRIQFCGDFDCCDDNHVKEGWGVVEEKPQPKKWSGQQDGLPPVNTECELRCKTGGWGIAKVKYMSDTMCVWLWKNGNSDQREWAESPWKMDFRPIRTAAEIAAEQRETAIREIMDIADVDCRVTAARLVDAGFKREVV